MSEFPDSNANATKSSDDIDARSGTSRRRFLRTTAAAGGAVALTPLATAQLQEGETIELGGETSGWQGVAPEDIADEENPTLELEEGATYEVVWENLDGQPHNFVIEGEDGEELERTELMSEQGETQSLEFEATSEMAEYYCEPHRGTMNGDVSVGGAGGQPAADGEEETDDETEGFFEPGAEIGLETVAEGMTAPTDFAAVEGEDRYFVADQTGELWLVDEDGMQDEPALDVSDQMLELGEFRGDYADPEQDYDERGLLGIELHPEFSENGRAFVHYSAPANDETPEGWSHVEIVSEFQADDDLETFDPDSERMVMEFQSPQYNHVSGPMAFGPDGYLYVPMGDGGGANDDMEGHVDDWYDDNDGGNGQDVSENLLGGVHRIDVDAEEDQEFGEYGIPEDNPLVDEEDALDEYYAWGFRNPFGISFDSEDRLFVADAGQDLFEEANLVEEGGNYGWNVKEGTHCFSTDSPSDPPEDCPDAAPDEAPYNGQELQDPIVEYPHVYEGEMVGIVIVGGHVYEAGDVEDLDGKYIFGDWTADPSREDPAGRLLAASESEGGAATDDGAANGTDDNATADEQEVEEEATEDTQDEPIGEDNETDDAMGDGDMMDDDEMMGDENGNESEGDVPEGMDPGLEGEEEVVPRDELWEMEELQVAGTEDGSFPYFVRQFGQDDDGNVYVLANREGVPEGDTGAVMQIVPPDEGEEIDVEDTDAEDQEPEEEATEDTQDEPINETDGNETAANETDIEEGGFDNETDGNETDLNESDA